MRKKLHGTCLYFPLSLALSVQQKFFLLKARAEIIPLYWWETLSSLPSVLFWSHITVVVDGQQAQFLE